MDARELPDGDAVVEFARDETVYVQPNWFGRWSDLAPEIQCCRLMVETRVTASYYLLRVVRFGPLVPARLWLCDHAPDDPPDNKLDRGRLSTYPRADIAGTEVDPQEFHDWWLYGVPVKHWRWPQPITEAEYRYQISRLRWAEGSAPADPTLRPRRKVDPASVKTPSFERENAVKVS